MTRTRAFVRRKWMWMCLNKPFWGHIALAIATIALVWVTPAKDGDKLSDLPVRLWGMVLQLIGALTVWLDLTKTGRDFGAERSTWTWLKGLFRHPPPVQGGMAITLQGANCTVTGHCATITQTGLSLEQRISRVEKDIAHFNDELSSVRSDVRKQKDELTSDLKRRTAELRESINSLENQLKDALVGNYAVLKFGAFWLVAGIILSTVAVEITNFFHMGWQLPKFW